MTIFDQFFLVDMFLFRFCSNLEKFSLYLITSKNEMEKCDMSKRNGEVRISNRFRSNRSEETGQTNG